MGVDVVKVVKIAGPILRFLYNRFLAGKVVKVKGTPVAVPLPEIEALSKYHVTNIKSGSAKLGVLTANTTYPKMFNG